MVKVQSDFFVVCHLFGVQKYFLEDLLHDVNWKLLVDNLLLTLILLSLETVLSKQFQKIFAAGQDVPKLVSLSETYLLTTNVSYFL